MDIISRERTDKSSGANTASVTMYRTPELGDLTLRENPSPNFGSQSPFHQRYSHYKNHGEIQICLALAGSDDGPYHSWAVFT